MFPLIQNFPGQILLFSCLPIFLLMLSILFLPRYLNFVFISNFHLRPSYKWCPRLRFVSLSPVQCGQSFKLTYGAWRAVWLIDQSMWWFNSAQLHPWWFMCEECHPFHPLLLLLHAILYILLYVSAELDSCDRYGVGADVYCPKPASQHSVRVCCARS